MRWTIVGASFRDRAGPRVAILADTLDHRVFLIRRGEIATTVLSSTS